MSKIRFLQDFRGRETAEVFYKAGDEAVARQLQRVFVDIHSDHCGTDGARDHHRSQTNASTAEHGDTVAWLHAPNVDDTSV